MACGSSVPNNALVSHFFVSRCPPRNNSIIRFSNFGVRSSTLDFVQTIAGVLDLTPKFEKRIIELFLGGAARNKKT